MAKPLSPARLAVKKACTERWREANREHARAYRKQYAAKNRERLQALKAAKRAQADERAKASAYSRAYYAAHKAARQAYAKAYREAHRELVQIKFRACRDANQDIARAATSAWRAKNPEANAVHTAKRRARKRGNGGKLTRGITQRLMAEQNSQCVYCAASLLTGFHLDHKMPLSRGGANEDSNVQLTCPLCNMRKHNKTHDEFLALRAA